MRPNFAEQHFAAVEAELNTERGAALGRTGQKLEDHFNRCQQLAPLVDAEPDSTELLHRYRQAWAAFEECRWRLIVQREALGLCDHRWVDRVFPRPARR
jgi:hypothetical protein